MEEKNDFSQDLDVLIESISKQEIIVLGADLTNIYFKKKDKHRVTYKSGGKGTQVDYVMCRRRDLKEMCDCKVIVNKFVAKQHRILICQMALMVKKKKAEKVQPKIRWWKLKKTSCEKAFKQEVTRILGGENGLPNE